MKLPAILDIGHMQYHADDTGLDVPTLSRSVADILTTQSPLHAYKAHAKLGAKGNGKKATKEMQDGSANHDWLLGGGQEIVIVDAPDWRMRKEPKDGFTVADPGALRTEIEAAGKLALLPKELAELKESRREMQEALDRRFADQGGWEAVTAGMRKESTIVWEEEGCIWRCRLDLYEPPMGEAWDLKFCYSADDESVVKKMRRENSAFQAVCYIAAMNALVPELAGRNALKFLFIESAGTDCRFGRPHSALLAKAESQRARAMKKWRTCLKSGIWPGYPDQELIVEAAAWELAAEFDKAVADGMPEPDFMQDLD